MNERIRILREDKELSRAAFGQRIGVSGDVINNLERGRVDIKDHIIKLICSEYSVNEHWLRTGNGSIYIEPETFSLDDFVKERGADELELAVVKAYFELEPDMRHKLVEHFKQKFSKLAQEDNAAPHGVDCEIPDTPEELERQFPPVVSEEEKSGAG